MKTINFFAKLFLWTMVITFVCAIIISGAFDSLGNGNYVGGMVFMYGTLPSFVLAIIFGTIKLIKEQEMMNTK